MVGREAKEAMEQLIDRMKPFMSSETAHPLEPGESHERRENSGFTAIVYQIKIKKKQADLKRDKVFNCNLFVLNGRLQYHISVLEKNSKRF